MLLNEFTEQDLLEKMVDPNEAIIRQALRYLDREIQNDPKKRASLLSHAFDVWQAFKLPRMSARDLAELYQTWRPVNECGGVGKITAQNKTKDVGYDAIRKQAAKFGNKVSKDGVPPLLREGVDVHALADELEKKYDLKDLWISDLGSRNALELSSIIVKPDAQRAGVGTAVMKEIVDLAEREGKIIVLDLGQKDPNHGTTSSGRLRKFYKRFGFKDNAGRNKNYEFRHSMIRYPGKAVSESSQLTELFNKPYDWTWSLDGDNAAIAEFTSADGGNMTVVFQTSKPNSNDWETAFKKGISVKRSGDGDQFAIFSTVVEVIKEFVSKRPALQSLTFDAKREGAASENPNVKDSRAELYKRMVSRFAKQNNMEFSWKNIGRLTEFTLRRKLDESKYPTADWNDWHGDRQYKDAGAKITMMTPDEFLSQVRPLVMDPESEENIDLLVQHIQDGGELDPLKIYPDGKEDGRHRALAAKKLGIKRVPVIVWPKSVAESYSPMARAIMEGGHGLDEHMDQSQIEEWLESTRAEMEEVDDASRFAEDEGEAKEYERDYRALAAVEMVLENNIKALNNPDLMRHSIFAYNIVTSTGVYGAAHVVLLGDGVAELKWLGSLHAKGKSLLHRVMAEAKNRGATKMKLTTKWESDGFYQKVGFTPDGETVNNVLAGSTNTPMSKTLESRLNEIEHIELDKDWGEVSRWRWNGKNTAKIQRVGKVAGLDIVIERGGNGPNSLMVYLVDRANDNKTVGEIQMYKKDSAWTTETSILTPAYQGRRIMLQVYTKLCQGGMILRSGDSQSPGGQKLWRALSEMPGITVYAGREEDGEMVYTDVEDHDGHLTGNWPLYDRDDNETDREYKNEIQSLLSQMDRVSAGVLKSRDPEEKSRLKAEYGDMQALHDKLTAERAAHKKKQPQHEWMNTALFAVADGVDLTNKY